MTDTSLNQSIRNHLREEERRQDARYREWLGSTLNSIYSYQWRCVATGGSAVSVRWRFHPRPGLGKRFRLRTIPAFVRHWCTGGYHTAILPGQTHRATLIRRYGPLLKIIKPRYWSDCDGCEPMLFRGDPEWSLESWLEHRRSSMRDWTAEDDERARAYHRERYGEAQP